MIKRSKPIAIWLFTTAGAVFVMALIGAITRLTESGLSMVDWKPVMGALPPMGEEAWMAEFAKYQTSPQYQQVNAGMSLSDFKAIFFWEWFHRLFGRLIGVLYAAPLLWFWVRGKIQDEAKLPLLGIFVLGGLQGLMGWYMVKSGLVDVPAVSHYRLAAHLGLAFVIFSCLFYAGLFFSVKRKHVPVLYLLNKHILLTLFVVSLTMLWGVMTAGLDAGLLYGGTFPLMGQALWPDEFLTHTPRWLDLLENAASVQFVHRCLAVLSLALVVFVVMRGLKANVHRRAFIMLLHATLLQVVLGVVTVTSYVHIVPAVAHQGVAMIVLMCLIYLVYITGRDKHTWAPDSMH